MKPITHNVAVLLSITVILSACTQDEIVPEMPLPVYKLKGSVYYADNLQPVSSALVYFDFGFRDFDTNEIYPNYSTVTNNKGQFFLSGSWSSQPIHQEFSFRCVKNNYVAEKTILFLDFSSEDTTYIELSAVEIGYFKIRLVNDLSHAITLSSFYHLINDINTFYSADPNLDTTLIKRCFPNRSLGCTINGKYFKADIYPGDTTFLEYHY